MTLVNLAVYSNFWGFPNNKYQIWGRADPSSKLLLFGNEGFNLNRFSRLVDFISVPVLRILFPSAFSQNIRLADDEDFQSILDSEGFLKQIEDGDIQCKSCNRQITISNISSFKKTESGADFFCGGCTGGQEMQ